MTTAELERDILDSPGYDDPLPEVDAEKLDRLRERLEDDAAEYRAREAYLGKVGTATIVDVHDKGAAIVFDVLLPDTTVGQLMFTDPEFSDAPLYDFLEFLGGTRSDPFSVMYETLPATFSEWKGWRVPIGENTGLKVYEQAGRTAEWFGIDEKTGGVTASSRTRAWYRAVSMGLGWVCGASVFATGGLESAFILGLVAWLVAWGGCAYMFAASSGMIQPPMKNVSLSTDEEDADTADE